MPQTGATRHQKFLKSEKAKTKLKAKKDLPKGTNVTKTNFKVKKIVIREQLKKHGETEALSARKLNVKELLARLNHFNTHSRMDALDGLKELITTHTEVLGQNLGLLIHGVTPLVLNIEKTVRRESLKVLHVMLSNITLEKIDPFFDILCTYLRSAMTDIDNRIQDDSLLFLDILLLCTPQRMAQDFHKIIPNFLDMISKLRVDSKPGRSLTVNLDSQITSVKWRVKVLHRLHDFLHKFVDHHCISDTDKCNTETTQSFDNTKMNNYSLFNPNYVTVCHVSCFSSRNQQDMIHLDEVDRFKDYVDTLMPLLLETWLEVCPNMNSDKNIETVVNEDAATLLKHTLEVIDLLWELVQHFDRKNPSSQIKNLFCQKYRQQFAQHLVHAFPFVTNIRTKQVKINNSVFEDLVTDPKLIAENLEICHFFIMLNPQVNVKSHNREITSVLNYIEKTFNQNNTQHDINNIIIRILNTIFSNDVNSWTKNLTVTDALFRKIIWSYFNRDLPDLFKQKIFTLLCKIALNDKLQHFHSSDAYEKWLNNLPDILLQPSITVQTIDIIHMFAVRSNYVFNVVIGPKLLKIIENLPTLTVSDGVNNDSSSYHKLFSLLFWIQNWDCDSLNLLEQQLLKNVYKRDHGKYIFDTLRLKSGGIL